MTITILAGVCVSAFVYFKGQNITATTKAFLTDEIPNYELIKDTESQFKEQERILYEYYTTTESNLIDYDLARTSDKITLSLSELNSTFPHRNPVNQIIEKETLINNLKDLLVNNLSGINRNWTQARRQLAEISTLTRESTELLSDISKIKQIKLKSHERNIIASLVDINWFVILYGVFAIVVFITCGQLLKAYLTSLSKANRLSLFPQRNPNPVLSVDVFGKVIFANPASKKMLLSNGIQENDYAQLFPENIQKRITGKPANSLHQRFDYEIFDRHLHCEMHWLEEKKEWDIHLKDITEQKKAEEKLNYQAFHNLDTTLSNKYALNLRLEELQNQSSMISLGIMELKDYKAMFALLGSEVTLSLTKEFARLLQFFFSQNLPNQSELYHVSDSQFAIIVNTVEEKKLYHHLNELLNSLSNKVFCYERKLEINIGVSLSQNNSQNSIELLRNAHMALEQATTASEHNIVTYSPQLRIDFSEEQQLLADIRRAIDNDEFNLHFQPQVRLKDETVFGAEVLIRWKNKEQWVGPHIFIPLAESSGMIIEIGAWVLKQACYYAKKIVDSGHTNFIMAVNISPRQFANNDFLTGVTAALQQSGLPAHNLELEITEGLLINDIQSTINVINKIRKIGIHVSIDDFGTGYSSLSYLSKFNINKLKIDQSFIRFMHENKRLEAIVKTVVDLGKNLNLSVIAEGVELLPHLKKLQQYGCDEIQGYFFSKPITFDDLVTLLKNETDNGKLLGSLEEHQQ